MSRALYLIILIAALLHPMTLVAQDEEAARILNQAEQDYQVGRFEQTLTALKENMSSFQDNDKQKALRLVALCYLAMDNEEQAEYYARQLINLNNYYSSIDDPARFEQMVKRLMVGLMTKITTASSVSENINEAPVPITIITADMIENLGYNKRLGQILATFVPGMAEVSAGTTDNMAMHGAYSEFQELILVMENGHRLNNRMFNSSPLDYSISTEKIDHIEVLRGPASSLYGNVALSAVVNIITKDGAQINGIKAKYGYGSFGTHKADLTMGTRFMDADIMVWGSIYKSDGQHRAARDAEEYKNKFYIDMLPEFHSYVDGYKDKPCYDLGLTFKLKGFDVQFSRKNSKKLFQYGDLWGYYDYDKYRSINDTKPGEGVTETHLEIGYSKPIGSVTVNASVYGDWYDHNIYNCYSPEFTDESMYEVYSKGMYRFANGKEHTMGGNLRASTTYKIGSMSGNFLVGSQLEHFRLSDYYVVVGENYTDAFSERTSRDEDDVDIRLKEKSLSFYAQGKHNFTTKLILNAGVRYDIKYRAIQDNEKAFSPRLALIYTPKEDFSMRLTYAKSFVDMSYNNRMVENSYLGSEYLPQYLTALQLNFMGIIKQLDLHYDVNLAYNHYKNLNHIVYEETQSKWNNEGSFKNFSLEASLFYIRQRLSAILNFYWSKDFESNNYYYSESEKQILAVPHLTANLNVGYKLITQKNHTLKVYGNANLQGSKLMSVNKDDGYSSFVYTDSRIDKTLVSDLGIKYTFKERLQLALDCENIFDTDRFITGPELNMFAYHQRGRTLMGSVAISF
ncbi:MAG: TonB-dependent receptor [Prevotella sp.]|nr:TonB-dependent receptor [Prevotella sp.]